MRPTIADVSSRGCQAVQVFCAFLGRHCYKYLVIPVRRRRRLFTGLLFVGLAFLCILPVKVQVTMFDGDRSESPADSGSELSAMPQYEVGPTAVNEVQRAIRALLLPPAVEREIRRQRRYSRWRRRRRSRNSDYSQHGQSTFVDARLKGRRNGFYIESGASDGETGSNTLYFELERNWTGLLIEANPESFAVLRSKHRRAWALKACLSPTGSTTIVRFRPAGGIGGIVDHMAPSHRRLVDRLNLGDEKDISITCFGLGDILASLPISPPINRIDYWSLDVEGAEIPILQSLNFSAIVPIDIISIEYKIKDANKETDFPAMLQKLSDLRRLFAATGLYRELGNIKDVDVVFERIDITHDPQQFSAEPREAVSPLGGAADGGEFVGENTFGGTVKDVNHSATAANLNRAAVDDHGNVAAVGKPNGETINRNMDENDDAYDAADGGNGNRNEDEAEDYLKVEKADVEKIIT
jgi:hypothetical protein